MLYATTTTTTKFSNREMIRRRSRAAGQKEHAKVWYGVRLLVKNEIMRKKNVKSRSRILDQKHTPKIAPYLGTTTNMHSGKSAIAIYGSNPLKNIFFFCFKRKLRLLYIKATYRLRMWKNRKK